MDSLLTSVGEGTELPKIDAKDTLIIFLALIGCVIFLISLKKIYYRFRLKKRYYIFPKISTKGISNIALVISISAAIILLLTLVTAGFMGILFRAYPGTRVTVEGILIKIGGLLFGPIIGVFIGGVTDLLSIALTAGMFHYGYFISACTYGLLAGFVRSIINISKGKRSVMISLGALYIGVCAMISIVYA
jgi:LytS/YehU family sensor histidine kinase